MLTVTLMATYCMGQLLRAAEMLCLLRRPQEEKAKITSTHFPFKGDREFCKAHATPSCCCDYYGRKRPRLIIVILI